MNTPVTSNPSDERARMEAFYNTLSLRDGVTVGWGRDSKTGAYHASFARNAWAAWQEAQRPVHETSSAPSAAVPLSAATSSEVAEAAAVGAVTIVTNEAGECVAVTRTDAEHRILSVIWERRTEKASGDPTT